MKKLFYTLFIIIAYTASATPEFSLWTGSNCSTCHVNFQGGGMRKEFGWTFGRDASFFGTNEPAFKWLYFLDKEKFRKFDSVFTIGTDFRLETFRSHKTPDAVRRVIPMQASIYANFNPLSWMSLEGQYNVAKQVFPGQTFWSASVIFQPLSYLPAIRAGRFQPSMGLRDCDMTSLDRRVPTPDGSEVVISPDYAEYGVEMIYHSLDWLQVNVGAFDSKSMHEVSSNGVFGFQSVVAVENNPSFNARFVIFPELLWKESSESSEESTSWFSRLLANFPASYIGASTFVNGRFLYNNAYLGFAIMDNLHSYFKFAYTNMPHVRHTNAYIAGLTYMPIKGLLLGARAEHGISHWFLDNDNAKLTFTTNQYVLNAKIFVLPYIELIPEYRFVNSTEYNSLRWTLQLHIYY